MRFFSVISSVCSHVFASSSFVLVSVVAAFVLGAAPVEAQDITGPGGADELYKWQPVELTFSGTERIEEEATFRDHRFDLLVTTPSGGQLTVPGFFAADGDAANTGAVSGTRWRARLLPREAGTYTYEARFRCGAGVAASLEPQAGSACEFDGAAGTFEVAAAQSGAPGNYARGLLSQAGRLMRFDDGALFFKGGPDSPEDLLAYSDFDNTRQNGNTTDYAPHRADFQSGDPTWDGGRGEELIGAINYLAAEGMNSISFISMNVDGDGDNVWPWTARDARFTYDASKLAQWNIVFGHATRHGFFLHFKTQETENDGLLGGLSEERRVYYRELVARFGHHHALNWNLGEENTNSDAERRAFAQYFKALDPYDHPVVVHTYPGDRSSVYEPLLGYEPFDGPSLQLGGMDDAEAWSAGREWLTQSVQAGDPWVCSIDEPGTASEGVYEGGGGPNGGNLPAARAVMYATYLAGCYGTEWYFGYSKPDDDLDLDDFRSRDIWWNQVAAALEAVRDFYDRVDPVAGTAHQSLGGSSYAMEGEGTDGTAQALAYLEDGTSSFGASYEQAVYVNPRTGERSAEQPVGGGGIDAPFSGDAVVLLAGGAGAGPEVTSLTLVNADTDEDLRTLEDGDHIDLSTLPTDNLNVRANAAGGAGSVVFALNGDENHRTESAMPYALHGDEEGDYNAWTPAAGSYTVAATPYSEGGGGGSEGTAQTAGFTVAEGVLPVELTAFEATADGRDVRLTWTTATETDNEGFEVQSRRAAEGGGAWTERAFVPSKAENGTTNAPQTYTHRVPTLEPGRYVFRLRQVDRDGDETFHTGAEATVTTSEAFVLRPPAPNPLRTDAQVRFFVRDAQAVRLELFNMLGRRVRVLYDGVVAAHTQETVLLRAGGLASGHYVLRLMGERREETQTVTLVR